MKMYKLHVSILDRLKNNVKSILPQDTFVIPSQLSKIVVVIILRTLQYYNIIFEELVVILKYMLLE